MSTYICPSCGHASETEPDDSTMPPDQLAWIVRRIAADSDKISPSSIMNGRNRARHLLMARRRAYLVLRLSDNSYPQIGRMFGRDHSTIMYACKNATDLDRRYAARVHSEFRDWLEQEVPA